MTDTNDKDPADMSAWELLHAVADINYTFGLRHKESVNPVGSEILKRLQRVHAEALRRLEAFDKERSHE